MKSYWCLLIPLAISTLTAPALAYGSNDYYGEGTYGCGVTPPKGDALLWSSRGGNPVHDFCCGKPDNTPLPTDPRSLIQPGISDGRNVVFNAFWRNCHVQPELVGEFPHPTTCGELRTRVAAGHTLMVPGSPEAGSLFSGTNPYSIDALLGTGVMKSETYNSLWKSWGFGARPPDYDFLVAQRYGSAMGTERNPYPLPGENPNRTRGGSGQLPVMFTQIREANGYWTGDIGITCQGCHNGEIGKASDAPGLGMQVGGGSSMVDWDLFLQDMLPYTLDYAASVATFFNLNRTRGTNNASDVNLAFLFPEGEGRYDRETLIGLIRSGSTAGMDTPAWWNMGHRPAKFIDGLFPMDAPRVDMVFYTPFAGLFGSLGGELAQSSQDWMRQNGQNGNEWVQILKSPAYPKKIDAIDTALAERGAQLFHELDLWSRNNPVPAPADKGNGSCASCHGAYAPRYFNDPSYLASPVLEGQAGNVTALAIIGTDPVRYTTNNEAMIKAGAVNFFGYPQLAGTENDCSPIKYPGYLAPPLYGVWANAPYFHNGSVPNLWQVLKPADRVAIWERVSTPKPSGMKGTWLWTNSLRDKLVMNYDTNLKRAFDFNKVGWNYKTYTCQNIVRTCTIFGCKTTTPPLALQCRDTGPLDDESTLTDLLNYLADSTIAVFDFLNANVILAWNVFTPRDTTPADFEERKIYNTHHFGQGNKGHEFNAVLTDDERWALIEYMKTL